MAVGFKIDFLFYPVGHRDFLHSFFSTISYQLELDGWGTKLVEQYLIEGRNANILKIASALGIGFVDGISKIIYRAVESSDAP